MSDRIFFSLIALAVVAIIALALVWPQGDGRRSPKPFGHATTAERMAHVPQLRPALAPASPTKAP
jgi:hypothetical protein